MWTYSFRTCAKPRGSPEPSDTETAIKRLAEMVPLVVVKLGHRWSAGAAWHRTIRQPGFEHYGCRCGRRRRQLRRRLPERISARIGPYNLPRQREPGRRAVSDASGRNRSFPRQRISRAFPARACALAACVGRTLLSADVGFEFDFFTTKTSTNGRGQECPPHILLRHFQQ